MIVINTMKRGEGSGAKLDKLGVRVGFPLHDRINIKGKMDTDYRSDIPGKAEKPRNGDPKPRRLNN